jgi:hypothetical protein
MTRSSQPAKAVLRGRQAPVAGDAALAVDALAIAAISAAICVASHRLRVMAALVPALILLRFGAWARLPPGERPTALSAEVVFFAICALVGGFNDWNSVVRHGIYDYDVPAEFPRVSTIPFWMLLYWGMILRAAATLAQWRGLRPPARLRNDIHLRNAVVESAALKVVVSVLLVVLTRLSIYRHARDPVLSWLPFAAALPVYALLFRPGRHGLWLAGVALVAGPAIEILYIHVGRLHHYQLGWLAGVPLWIALWWVLAMWVWSDLAVRLQLLTQKTGAGTSPEGSDLYKLPES